MPSIFDKFLILFETNADEVKKGTAVAKTETDKLNSALATTANVSTKVGVSFNNLINQAKNTLLTIVGTGSIIAGITQAANYANQLDDLSKALNISVVDLDIWGRVVEKKGGSVQDFQNTLKTVTAALTDFAVRGTSRLSPFFQELGIRMTDSQGKARDFLSILPELADRFSKLDKAQSFGLGQKLGLDQGTIFALQSGRREIETLIDRQKQLGIVTEKDTDIAAAFMNQWGDTKRIFESVFLAINRTVLPILTDFLNGYEKIVLFFKGHNHLITGAIIAVAGAVTYFLLPAIANLLITASPFLKMVAIITALGAAFALVYEDIQFFLEGHDSLIGEIVKRWPQVGVVINGLIAAFKNLIEQTKVFFEVFKSTALSNFIIDIKIIIGLIQKLADIFFNLKNFFSGGIRVPDITIASNYRADLDNPMATARNTLIDPNVLKELQIGQNNLRAVETFPLNSQNSTSISNSLLDNKRTIEVSTGPITINTQATNANDVALDFSEVLSKQFRQALENFDDGVIA